MPGHDYSTTAALARIVDQRTLDGLRHLQERYPPETEPGRQITQVIQQMSRQLGQREKKPASGNQG